MANQGERYAQISETLIDHPKMTELSRSMRINRFQLLGHLTCLWNWAMKNAPDGDLSRFSSRHIADAARITDADDFSEESDEKAQQFVTALVNCRTHDGGAGFLETIEGQIVIHDWDQYGGKFGTKVDKNAFFSWIKRQRDKGIIIPTTDENFDIWSQDRDALLSHFTTDTVATVSQHKSDTFATPSDLNSKAKQSKAKQRIFSGSGWV